MSEKIMPDEKFSYYVVFSHVLPNGKMLINSRDHDCEGPMDMPEHRTKVREYLSKYFEFVTIINWKRNS